MIDAQRPPLGECEDTPSDEASRLVQAFAGREEVDRMRWARWSVMVLVCLGPSQSAITADMSSAPARHQSSEAEVKMEQVGKTFLFDYGQLHIRVRYVSDRTLEWQQVKGPEVGLKGEEDYGSAAIRPGVYFLWWQEKDTSVVTQVVDFERRIVYTTWLSPDKKLASFQGTVKPQEQ